MIYSASWTASFSCQQHTNSYPCNYPSTWRARTLLNSFSSTRTEIHCNRVNLWLFRDLPWVAKLNILLFLYVYKGAQFLSLCGHPMSFPHVSFWYPVTVNSKRVGHSLCLPRRSSRLKFNNQAEQKLFCLNSSLFYPQKGSRVQCPSKSTQQPAGPVNWGKALAL